MTGAGISAESGLGTFRDEGGLWAQHRIEDVATPEGFARNPELIHDFYNACRIQAAAESNAAHLPLAQLEAQHPGEVIVITQNVDDLHEKAGSRTVIHMHGTLFGALCPACGNRWQSALATYTQDSCPRCSGASTRRDVVWFGLVWFGEFPYAMQGIETHLAEAEPFVSIRTSAQVYPAANFVETATLSGARTLEFNLEPSAMASRFDACRFGSASETLPLWVAEILA